MIVGVPREVKEGEERVALTPAGAKALRAGGHEVLVETDAGEFCGFTDAGYEACGAKITTDQAEIWERVALVLKVKEPLPEEYGFLRPGLAVFAFLHLAANRGLIDVLMDSGVTAIAYETVQLDDGALPLLAPMSEVAGCIAVQNGAYYLEAHHGGRGVLLPGISGSPPGRVTVIGGGIAGVNACRVALGMGSEVTVLEISPHRLEYLRDIFGGRISTVLSSAGAVEECLPSSDLTIGAVLIPGKRAPRLMTRETVENMCRGSVFVDIAIDQGGISETSRPTTHQDPVFVESGVLHCCIPNLPAAVPRSSTLALTARTLTYAMEIADRGLDAALAQNAALARGVNVRDGEVVHQALREA